MELLAFDDAISSNRSAASQDKVPSDSEDERRKPRENTDKHGDEAMGNGAITSDTEDYESHVEFSPNPPAIAGAQERAASPDSSDFEGSLSDSASDSDDSSSDSDLDIRASQRKAHRRRRAVLHVLHHGWGHRGGRHRARGEITIRRVLIARARRALFPPENYAALFRNAS